MVCPSRENAGLHRDTRTRTLQAVRFADNRAPGLNLQIDEELRASNSLATAIQGYSLGLVEPTIMLGFKPMGPVRVVPEVITTSPGESHPNSGDKMPRCAPLFFPLVWPMSL